MLFGFISFLIRILPSFSQNTSSADNGTGEVNKQPVILATSLPTIKVKCEGFVPTNVGSIIDNKIVISTASTLFLHNNVSNISPASCQTEYLKMAIDFNDKTRENKINKLEIETKLKEKFSPVHIDLVDKSHTHTSDKHIETMKDKERLYDLTIIAEAFKPMSLVERHKAIYKELDIMNNPGIHGMKIKASSPEEWKE